MRKEKSGGLLGRFVWELGEEKWRKKSKIRENGDWLYYVRVGKAGRKNEKNKNK